MKKIRYIFLSILSIAALFSCSDTEDIRNDIDDLNARLDKLEAQLPQMNEAIANYQGLINGKYMIVGYTAKDDGDYVLELSNGESLTVNVYSGKVTEEDLPLIEIRDGYWYYKYPGDTDYSPLTGDDGQPVKATIDGKTPTFQINDNGYWEYSWNGEDWIGGIGPANPDKAFSSIFSEVEVSSDGSTIKLVWADGTATIPIFAGLSLDVDYGSSPVAFSLGDTKEWNIVQGEKVDKIVIETIDWKIKVEETKMTVTAPSKNALGSEYKYTLVLKIFSKEGYCRAVTIPVTLLTTTAYQNSANAWQNFLSKNDENVLLDYSYAGYNYGENVPIDGNAWGYTVYNVKEYMDTYSLTAREAFVKIIADKGFLGSTDLAGTEGWANRGKDANMVIYFPEGTYVLHNDDDNTNVSGKQTDVLDSKGNNVSTGIRICANNIIIKGAGAGKTFIKMETPNLPTDVNNTGSSPELINIGHTNNLEVSTLSQSNVNAVAEKGTFSVTVDNVSWITSGKWVQLRVRSNATELVNEELGPIKSTSEWAIVKTPVSDGNDAYGVKVTELHQVKSVSGNTITFHEPIMHKVDPTYGWVVRDYKCLQNVGVEDLTFVGNALDGYSHHGDDMSAADKKIYGWQYDGAYKPLVLSRCVNSWVRNVNFTSVSEALSINESANCSAYKINIDGIRGHSAVRAQHSSRVFIGAVRDNSSGKDYYSNSCYGQFHGCGVSKPSIGTVVWNCTWGTDACFEAHATQPRATLFDCCSGGLVYYRAGGAENEAPNHLSDLTIWNLNVTGTDEHAADFAWWSNSDKWWKIYPPILVGVHGASITWNKGTDDAKQYTYEESTGTKVVPESLYEAQLRERFNGVVPAWLNALK